MRALPMPEGRPGEHLGLSHVAKHYLSPAEAWEDIADDVSPELRPRALLECAPVRRPHARIPLREPDWSALGPLLRPALHEAWWPLLARRLAPLPSPPEPPWMPASHRRWWQAHVGAGIVVRLRYEDGRGAWRLHTAFRPLGYPLRDYECLPRDRVTVSRRRRLAELNAEQLVSRPFPSSRGLPHDARDP